MLSRSVSLLAGAVLLALAGCSQSADIDSSGGVSAVRSPCPAVGIPAYTGDVTLFDPPASRDARAIDVTATITNVQTNCGEGEQIVSTSTFDVQARRTNTQGAREVVLPYFASVMRGGNAVISKRVDRVTLRFADGEARATVQGTASGIVNRAAATLPEAIRKQIVRKRKPGDEDAASDPLADPTVRAAVARASFEVLIGFQLTAEQLEYNVRR